MGFNALQFFRDNGVNHWVSGKNVREGFVHCRCPFCDDPSNHLGINPKNGSVACWRCKAGSLRALVSKLLRVSPEEAERVIGIYDDGVVSIRKESKEIVYREGPMTMPGKRMERVHRNYLRKRGFDDFYLEEKYGLLGTMPMEKWEGVDVGYRIMIPVHDRYGRLVAWQGRDYTGQSELRYKGSPIEKSKCSIKHTLYGAQNCSKDRVFVVEGVFDLWRMGDDFVCTYGTSLEPRQINLLSEWKEVVFVFDCETEAQEKAMGYAKELSAVGVKASVIAADFGLDKNGEPRDCGDLTEQEAKDLRLDLL